jgi:hypothetical protein
MEEKRMSERSTRHGVLGRLSVILGICACLAGCRLVVNASDPTPSPDPAATPAPEASSPEVSAGNDKMIAVGAAVWLNGTARGFSAGPVSCRWSFAGLPRGSTLGPGAIGRPDSLSAVFTPDVDGVYYLDLTVSCSGLSLTDRVIVTARYDLNLPPEAYFPVGAQYCCKPGESFWLEGYVRDPERGMIRYAYGFDSQPAGSVLCFQADDAARPMGWLPRKLLKPIVEGRYDVRLDMFDERGARSSKVTSFTVKAKNPRGNSSPIANAGPDLYNYQNSEGSSVFPTFSVDYDGDALSYSWKCVSYPDCFPPEAAASLAMSGSSLSLPLGLPAGDYVYELTVDDGTIQGEGDEPPTSTDTMTYTVRDTPARIGTAETNGSCMAVGQSANLVVTMLRDPDISCDPSRNVEFACLRRPDASRTSLVYSFAPQYSGNVSVYAASLPLDAPGYYLVSASFRDHNHTFTRIFSFSAVADDEGGIDVSVY